MTTESKHVIIGNKCPCCDERISVNDRTRPIHVFEQGEQRAHTECLLREVMGGIGHLIAHDYWCGGEKSDPDAGLTYRQSALLVDAYVKIVGLG